MKKTIVYMLIAIIGNALGTALMQQTDIGMTAWGSSALNTSNYLGVSLGNGFIILSVFFYIVAIIIAKKFVLKDMLLSALFLFCFAYLTDVFLLFVPEFISLPYIIRILINVVGLLILLFSIAVHLNVNLAVHPMDVFLKEVQLKLKSIAIGTYVSYFLGFMIGIVFGLLHGSIEGIGVGTIITLVTSGLVMKFYNDRILHKWDFERQTK